MVCQTTPATGIFAIIPSTTTLGRPATTGAAGRRRAGAGATAGGAGGGVATTGTAAGSSVGVGAGAGAGGAVAAFVRARFAGAPAALMGGFVGAGAFPDVAAGAFAGGAAAISVPPVSAVSAACTAASAGR